MALKNRPLAALAPLREIMFLALALLSYFQYPGHTYLESDTQVYIPMFERLRDPALLERDPMAVRPHTAFTLYDELVLGLNRVTGLGFEGALGLLQVGARLALVAGVFLITRAMGLSEALALACAGVYALGGWVRGPSVLLVEYEPVPRALALGPVLLGIGLAAHRRYLAAGAAGAVAFLIHATTSAPFWAAFALLMLVPDEPEEMKSRLRSLAPLAVAVLVLKMAATLQPGLTEPQAFLGKVDPDWEKLLRLRSSYVFVDQWPSLYFWQYGLMLAAGGAAYWRLQHFIQPTLRFFVLALGALGVLSLPVSYLLLEKMKWAMVPQAQPLRTILFVEMFAMLLAMVMAFELACREKRIVAACWWAALALAIGIDARLLLVLAPVAIASLWGWRAALAGLAVAIVVALLKPFGAVLWRGIYRGELLLALGLGAAFVAAAVLSLRRRVAGAAAVAAVVLLAFYLVPGRWRLHWSGRQQNPPLVSLSEWARSQTDRNAVFLFGDSGRAVEPGIFRALAARALYVDWKGGGQSNFFHEFSRIWWARWQQAMAEPFRREKLPRFHELGIDYVVLSTKNRLADRRAVFENAGYVVYRLE